MESRESVYSVDIFDAHSNAVIANDLRYTGSLFIGAIAPNIDIKAASSSGMDLIWNNASKSFEWHLKVEKDVTYVHVKSNSITLHIGANSLQDISVSLGNFNSEALGVHNVLVVSNELANIAIGKIDIAINRVSAARAALGAIHNRLDNTVKNLTTASENLVSSESRIRDCDMAKEMMEFIKADILSQSASAMLTQAIEAPQSVRQLLS
jgi:flagellin